MRNKKLMTAILMALALALMACQDKAPTNLPPLGEALAAAEFPFKSEGDGGRLSLFCPLWHAISTNVSAKTIAVANLSLFISHYSLFTFHFSLFPLIRPCQRL